MALLRWVVARGAGSAPNWHERLREARTVTFVCHGNIIRSPLAAEAFAREVERAGRRDLVVRSAGVAAHDGGSADARAIESASERGYQLERHRARLFDDDEARTDAILVMDLPNVGRILGGWPDAAGRLFLLGGLQADGGMRLREIHDPVVGTLDDVRHAHDEVLRGVAIAAQALRP